jgi:hypothetical protein
MMTNEFPGKDKIKNPLVDLRYEIRISGKPNEIWPWIKQLGYHRGGWYIDTWWDKIANSGTKTIIFSNKTNICADRWRASKRNLERHQETSRKIIHNLPVMELLREDCKGSSSKS